MIESPEGAPPRVLFYYTNNSQDLQPILKVQGNYPF